MEIKIDTFSYCTKLDYEGKREKDGRNRKIVNSKQTNTLLAASSLLFFIFYLRCRERDRNLLKIKVKKGKEKKET